MQLDAWRRVTRCMRAPLPCAAAELTDCVLVVDAFCIILRSYNAHGHAADTVDDDDDGPPSAYVIASAAI